MVKYRLSTFGTSCNWPRVISPTPGRSTLITSAPNHASNCVQVGPDWTWVKSRMRTPFSALVICSLHRNVVVMPAKGARRAADLFLLQLALRIEVADPAAFAAGRRIQYRVDQSRLARIHGRIDRALQLVRRGRIDADTAKGLHHPV